MRKHWYRFRIASLLGLVGVFALLQFYGSQRGLPILAMSSVSPAASNGTVVGDVRQSAGDPVANTVVSLMTIPGHGQMPILIGTASTDARGGFQLANVVPGSYNAQVSSRGNTIQARVTVQKNVVTHVQLTVN